MKRTNQLPLLADHPHCYGKAWNPKEVCSGHDPQGSGHGSPPCKLYVECAEETKTLRHYYPHSR